MAQNRLLFTRSLAGFLGSLGKFLIALTIDNLSLGICLALHGASAKKHKVLLPGAFGNVERKQNLRGRRAVERSGGARAWSTKSIAARLMALEAGSLYLSSRHAWQGKAPRLPQQALLFSAGRCCRIQRDGSGGLL